MGLETDTLSFLSLNSSKKALHNLPSSARKSYVQSLIETSNPDICFDQQNLAKLKPGDVSGYDHVLHPSSGDTVLLYDTNRVYTREQNLGQSLSNDLPGLDRNEIVTPAVEIETRAPIPKGVVKEFSVVSWHEKYFKNASSKDKLTMAESVTKYSQRVAMETQKPVLICGEFDMPSDTVEHVINKNNVSFKRAFLNDQQQVLEPHGFLPSMTEGATRETWQKAELQMHRCRPCENIPGGQPPDTFISSKSLQCSEPALMDVRGALGVGAMMGVMNVYTPTQFSLRIPPTPAIHFGG